MKNAQLNVLNVVETPITVLSVQLDYNELIKPLNVLVLLLTIALRIIRIAKYALLNAKLVNNMENAYLV